MESNTGQRMGRRAVLGAAVGGAAAAAATALAAPAAVLGDNGGSLILGQDNTATAQTSLFSTGAHAFYAQTNAGDGLRGWTDGAGSSGVFGYASNVASFGVYGKNGGRGVAALGTYDAALWASNQGYGAPLAMKIEGNATLLGLTSLTQGTAAAALKVNGKAVFSRSGKAVVAIGRSSVDVDLRSKGGLAGTPLCFANLTSFRSGVHVAAVRPNYPIAGKLRIYLNRSVTSAIAVAWVVMG